ncbi:MAG: hypothetical protein GY703_06510, partial [Gammaproteobacteria bacterium]|nr:hypothetical protein [Gammaproteobacteria bacterium]
MNISVTSHLKKILREKSMVPLALAMTACCISSNAMAMTVPAAGSFAYDLYDIGVN